MLAHALFFLSNVNVGFEEVNIFVYYPFCVK